MRIICDAPDQTCNRLWTHVALAAQCIAEQKIIVSIFCDRTIEDFHCLLNAKFFYFPLWHKWYLEHRNVWNKYKGLTWKVAHNNKRDRIFFYREGAKGWQAHTHTCYLRQTQPLQKIIFRPIDEIIQKIERITRNLRKGSDIVVRVNIWRQCMTDGTIIPSMSFTHPCNR